MPTEVKQSHRYCRTCGRKTLHVAVVKTTDTGCGFHFANLILSVVTFGLWVPVWILITGLAAFSSVIATAPYLCQNCGQKN